MESHCWLVGTKIAKTSRGQ